MKPTIYQCVTTIQGIRDYLSDAEIIAFDFETAPDEAYRAEEKAALDPARAHIVGCAFSASERTGIYVPVAHKIGANIDRTAFFLFLSDLLANPHITKVAHNIAFESSMAYAKGIVIQPPVYDTIAAAQMTLKSAHGYRRLNESGLKHLAGELLGESLPTFAETTGGETL